MCWWGDIGKFQIYWGGGTSELKSTRQGGQKSLPVCPPPSRTFLIATALSEKHLGASSERICNFVAFN